MAPAPRVAQPLRTTHPEPPVVLTSAAQRHAEIRPEATLGMVVLDFANPYFGEVARAAESVAAAAGYGLLLTHSGGSAGKQRAMLELLESSGVAGILLTPVQGAGDPDIVTERAVPLVVVDCHGPDGTTSAVAVDNVQGGGLAGEHLVRSGHRRIALVNGPLTIEACAQRREGLLQAVVQARLDPAEVVVEITVPSTNQFEGQQVADAVVESGATAVLCVNDLLAVGLIRELGSRGIAVPGDIAVMGYDDIDLAYTLTPALTTIRQPMREMGTWAAQQLLAQIDGSRPRHREFVPTLVVRESTVS